MLRRCTKSPCFWLGKGGGGGEGFPLDQQIRWLRRERRKSRLMVEKRKQTGKMKTNRKCWEIQPPSANSPRPRERRELPLCIIAFVVENALRNFPAGKKRLAIGHVAQRGCEAEPVDGEPCKQTVVFVEAAYKSWQLVAAVWYQLWQLVTAADN